MGLPDESVTGFKWLDPRESTGDFLLFPDGFDRYARTDSNSAAASHTWTTNPATGQPWTISEVNALQAGIKVEDASMFVRVTQLYVSVNLGDSVTYAHNDGATGMNQLVSLSGAQSATFAYTFNGDLWMKNVSGVTFATRIPWPRETDDDTSSLSLQDRADSSRQGPSRCPEVHDELTSSS